MQGQDWTPFVIKNKNADNKAKAFREGRTEAIKKISLDHKSRKLEQEDEVKPIEKVSRDISVLVQQGRMEKKLTQKELAQKLNIKPEIIRDIEAGKLANDKQIISKLQRILGVRLLGKQVGEKF